MGMGRGALRSRPAYQPRKEARELRADLGQLTGCGRVFRDARVEPSSVGEDGVCLRLDVPASERGATAGRRSVERRHRVSRR